MKRRSRPWFGKPAVRAGLWLWLAFLVTGTAPAGAKSLLVEGVEVTLTPPAGGDGRQQGMAMGKDAAFQRLLPRMVTALERQRRRASLEALRKEAQTLTERVIIRSEKRQADQLSLVMDVAFAEDGVRRLLERQEGLAFNITPYPPVLLLLVNEKQGEVVLDPMQPLYQELAHAAAWMGMAVAKPLDDMDDMVHISWSALRDRDPQLLQWLFSRYPARTLWVAGLTQEKGKGVITLHEIQEDGQARDLRETTPAVAGEPLALAAKTLVGRLMDDWIQTHGLHPGLRHSVAMRLLHGPEAGQSAVMIQTLDKVPGVSQKRLARLQAHESLLHLVYEGKDETLTKALHRMGWLVEKAGEEWLVKLP